jgi:hypothetical protein
MLAVIGVFDILGHDSVRMADRSFSSRYLLFIYYALRGLLLVLPSTLAPGGPADRRGIRS